MSRILLRTPAACWEFSQYFRLKSHVRNSGSFVRISLVFFLGILEAF